MKKVQSFLKLPFIFDIEKLKDDLDMVQKDEWVAHPNTSAYEGVWEVSSLTSTDGNTKNIVAIEEAEYKQTPLLNRTKYIKSVIESFKTKVEAVRFMKLGSNSYIKEHCDKGSCFEDGYARLHIPIVSNGSVEFILSGTSYKMELGSCYYIDANNPHAVNNEADSDRIHLLIDCHVNDWLKEFFLKGGFVEPVYKYGDKSITDKNVDQVIESFGAMGTQTALKMAKELEKKKQVDGKSMYLEEIVFDDRIDDFKMSLEIGKLGILHLKSLWFRKIQEIRGKKQKSPLLDQLDYFVLDGLNIPIAKATSYLFENSPTFEEFENWIVLQGGGKIPKEILEKVNDAVKEFCEKGQQDYPLKIIIENPVFSEEEMMFWDKNGYIVLKNAVDKKECKELENAIWQYLELSPSEPENWSDSKKRFWINDFTHPLLEKNRNSKRIKKAFAQLWGTDKLFSATHRLSFNPPVDKSVQHYGPCGIHWDISLATPVPFNLFGMLYLNDIKKEQGAFQCIPRFHKNLDTWLENLPNNTNPREEILKEQYQKDIVKVPSSAGDLVISRASLPHGSSLNSSDYPRFVHYINMYPSNQKIHEIWK